MDDQSKKHATFLLLYHVIFGCQVPQKVTCLLWKCGKEVVWRNCGAFRFFWLSRLKWIKIIFMAWWKANRESRHWLSCGDWNKNLPLSFGKDTKKSWKSISGRKGRCGVRAISAAPLKMQAKKLFASTLKVKGEARHSSTRLKTSWMNAAPV